MKAYLVTKSGTVGEYEAHPFEIKKMVESGRYRNATIAERLKFVENRDAMLRNERHPGLLDVFFVAPKTGNRDGYSIVQEAMVKYFMQNGVFLNRYDRGQRVVFCYNYPYHLLPYKDRDVLLYTMFETTRFPEDWEEPLKAAKALFFPAKFCQEIAQKQFGLDSEVLPHGIEVRNFPFIHRKRTPKDVFTFLHYDAFKYRKGWDIALTAFDEEFAPDEKVRLVFKTTYDAPPLPLKAYEKVEIITGKVPQGEMHRILSESDCFLFPTRGEGFGMTPLEAMATGMPAIVPNAFGIAEYFDERFCLPLDIQHEVARYDNFAPTVDLGCYKTPTVSSVRKAMRSAYRAWKNGQWITQWPELSRECSEYAHGYSLEGFSYEMARRVKMQCLLADVRPEVDYGQ